MAKPIVEQFTSVLGLKFSASDDMTLLSSKSVFCYIYAILYSEKYRKKYFEFLKIGFPRIPYPTDQSTFFRLADLGNQLIEAHLETRCFDTSTMECSVDDGRIQSLDYHDGKLFINKTSWFAVPEEIYEMEIGCYQVTTKWLKDRKGQTLTPADIEHYKQMIQALIETQRIMKEIDEVIEL